MRMELIQPFIDAADSVFSESLQSPAKIGDLSMDENAYRRKGVAALIAIKGDIEGRVILDLSPEVAVKIASQLAGIEAVERIVRQHADARIVMVSSVGYQENILAALQKGAKHFVQKPVKPEVLYEILRYVLSDDPTAAGAPVALAGEHRS